MSDDTAVNTETEDREPGAMRSSAHELGDITGQRLPDVQKLAQTVGTDGDDVDYYRFELSESREVRLGLKLRQGEAELSLEDAEGNVLARSMAVFGQEAAVRTLLPGTYYVRVESVGSVASEYEFRYGVLEAHASYLPASYGAWYAGLAQTLGMPSFGEADYAFELSETAHGSVSRVLLGTVMAVDPNGESLSYGIVGGNGSGLFAIDETSGELFYAGPGEDFESGVTTHELTVRASDGTHTIDTTVTVTVTDAAESPAFGAGSYAFALAENADGSVERVSLGTVSATDPDGDAVRYSLAGGNESGLFAIDAASGEVFYVGPGEDYESGVTAHELTVRASDGTHTIDTTVAVAVTDAAESPAFVEESYAFALSENVDGSVNRLSLGTVVATDPDGESLSYGIVGGNGSGLFAIDETSGEVFYAGPGEDYESGVTTHELTVRASDGTHTIDTTVTVAVTDAAESPVFVEESYAFAVSENVDGSAGRALLGVVSATDSDGGAVRYSLEGGNGSGLFAIDEASGELFYIGRGEDYESGVTAHELTVRASDGTHTIDTTVAVAVTDAAESPAFVEESYAFALSENVDGSVNRLSLGTVVATDPDGESLSYGIVGGNGSGLFAIDETSGEVFYAGPGEDYESGVTTHELTVRASDGTHTIDTTVTVAVTDAAESPVFVEESYAFAVSENVDGSAGRALLGVVSATDSDGGAVRYSLEGGNGSGLFAIDEASGEVFYVGPGEDYESGVTAHELTVRASDGTHTIDTTVAVAVTDAAESPAFGAGSYAFALAENADGSVNRLSLGTVVATDPDGDPLVYSLAQGNESGRFAVDGASGELFYTGTGEDHESGTASYVLTVRASDGNLHNDVNVTVTVTDAAEPPVFTETGYEFDLSENADGSTTRVSLGAVSAVDPDGDRPVYSFAEGNESGRFAIDGATGELLYTGTGEDHKSGTASYVLTVRASAGAHSTDTTVTVRVVDESVSEPADEDFAQNAETRGWVLVDRPPVEGNIESIWDQDWYAVEFQAGRKYVIDYRGHDTSDGTLLDPYLYAVFDPDGNRIPDTGAHDDGIGLNSRLVFTATRDGTHYISAAGNGDLYSGTGTYELEVRDAAFLEAAFSAQSSTFSIEENVEGRPRVKVGEVAGTLQTTVEPVAFRVVEGNERGMFQIGRSTGAIYYTGAGEDFESGPTSYELRVEALFGDSVVADRTVTVVVTDVEESPVFLEKSYAFDLAENADGSTNHLLLGTVSSTDPEGDVPVYSLVGGNESGRFAIDESTGELFYIGPGEDREGVASSYRLTVRAGDGSAHSDVNVTVTLTNVAEPPAFSEDGYAFDLEQYGDGSTSRMSLGTVSSTDPEGDVPVYSLVGGNESGKFAIDESTGELFYIGLGGDHEGVGSSYTLTVRAGDGSAHSDVNVTLTVTNSAEPPTFSEDGYAFDLAENGDGSTSRMSLGTVSATDPDGDALRYSLVGGNESGRFAIDESTGELFYVGAGEDYEGATSSYRLAVRAGDGSAHSDVNVMVTVTNVAEPPAFSEDGYAFDLAEHGDGSTSRMSLGTVSATDPDGDALRYSLVGGNESGKFAIDESTGELFYIGLGGDHEGVGSSYTLTVRAGDGSAHSDVNVTFTVTNSAESPTFSEDGYAFDLAENGDGSTSRMSLGTVSATDPGGDALRYSLVGGNESGRFAIDESTGELFYVGAGEDYESGAGPFKLAVQASDGPHAVDTSVTVTVTDVRGSMEPAGEDLPASTTTSGVVVVDEGSVTGTLRSQSDRDWFAVTLAPGRTYRFALESETDGRPSAPDAEIRGIRDANGTPIPGTGSGSDVRFTTDKDATDTAYYVEVGGGSSGEAAQRGLSNAMLRSIDDTRGTSDEGTRYSLRSDDVTELAADTTTTGTVPVGGSVHGNIEIADDVDWFAVELEAGRVYWIELRGMHSRHGTLRDPHLNGVYDPDGNLIPGTTNSPDDVEYYSRVSFKATTSGIHHVEAGVQGLGTGTYRLTVREINDDFAATVATAATVAVGGSVEGTIERGGEVDWFAVELVAGRGYRIYLEGFGSWDADTYLHGVYDADGNWFSNTWDDHLGYGWESLVTFTPTEDGTYYVAAGYDKSRVGAYTLSLREYTDDFAATTGTTGTVAVGGSATGRIEEPLDADWFAVELVAGRIYRIHVQGGPEVHGVHDANGVNIMPVEWVRGSRVTFTAPETDTYYVAVRNGGKYDFRWNADSYSLQVTDVTDRPDDYPDGTGTTGTVAVGGSATGEIEFNGDRDWFAVTLEANKTYRFDLKGSDSGAGSLYDPYLRGLYDSDGNRISGTGSDAGGIGHNSRVTFSATEAGTYYVSAGADGWFGQGTYTLSVTDVTDGIPDDYAAGTGTTGTVAVGGSATGEIEFNGDRDWFAVTLEANKSYRFDLEGRGTGSGSLYDPYLHGLYDSDGNLIRGTSNDDGGKHFNSRVTFIAAEAGNYYVSARAYGWSHQGTYTLSVEEVTDSL